jgi:hypothetical protein
MYFPHDPMAAFVEGAGRIVRSGRLSKSPLGALADHGEGGGGEGGKDEG